MLKQEVEPGWLALKCSLHRQQGNIPGVLCQAVSWLPENYPCHFGLTVTALVGYFLLKKNIQIPRTARVQRSARLFGDIIHSEGVTTLLRNALLSGRAPDDFTYTDWFYGYRPKRKERSDGY